MIFTLIKEHNAARAGKLIIDNTIINTPVFMPVATKGNIKTLSSMDMYDLNYKLILSNTLHLMINSNKEILKKYNGIKNYINWNRAILTDSGGFQTHSIKNTITKENGVIFKSIKNGKNVILTPKISIKFQEKIKSNIIMVLDECTNYPSNINTSYISMKKSLNWTRISKNNHTNDSLIFGIVQGSIYPELRNLSLTELQNIKFDGYAIGGLSVGEPKKDLFNILEYMSNKLPKNKPRYLMGVGSPEDIIDAVTRGIDMFDCVFPTRNARNGYLYTSNGIIKIKNKTNKSNQNKLDENCSCITCKNYTISYLNNLYKSKEMVAYRLNTIHNLEFYKNLMENIRKSIISNKLEEFLYKFKTKYTKK